MSPIAARALRSEHSGTAPGGDGLLEAYRAHVAGLAMDAGSRSARLGAARVFLDTNPDLPRWMTRPLSTRLRDLHRAKAWPFVSWCLIEGYLRPDVELLLGKPGGAGLPATWAERHAGDVARLAQAGRDLGWSENWIRQVSLLAACTVCLHAGVAPGDLREQDFTDLFVELEGAAHVSASARSKAATRCFALQQACYQLGTIPRAPRRGGKAARSPAQLAEAIVQPEIRREVVRYAATLSTTLKTGSVAARVKALAVFFDYLAESHPDVARVGQLDRTAHVEPFLVWARHRPWRGANRGQRTISLLQFHHDLVDLRCFFEDIASWQWPSAPDRRLLFVNDLPRLPDPLPRALPPAADAALMAAVAGLHDPLVRTGLQLLRATGMRIGELLDLELDCLLDFAGHGTWLRVPLGKLGTERTIPLDADSLAVLDAWTAHRGTQRSLPRPRDGHPADFLFCEGGRRPTAFRLRRGLVRATAAAGLQGPDGTALHVTPHSLRHTFGTSLINGGISLPALMALLGHVTPEMTLRYAKLASPTVRAAYDDAMAKVRVGRLLPIAPVGITAAIPDRVTWLSSEMLKTRVAHGYCSRSEVAGACPYANICEQCDNYQPAPEFTAALSAQLADIEALRSDAHDRGWDSEATRHQRVADSIEGHLRRIEPATTEPTA
jgi:integrase